MPEAKVAFNPGFADETVQEDMRRAVRAHLKSFEPKHEDKIAGVGFLISQIATIER